MTTSCSTTTIRSAKITKRELGRKFASNLLRRSVYLGAFGLASFGLSGDVSAGTPCDTYQPSCGAGICDCGKCDSMNRAASAPTCGCGNCGSSSCNPNPLFKTLDTVAGGIEKVFGLDKCKSCGSDSSCDSGCDSAEWLTPMSPALPVLPPMTSIKPAPSAAPPMPLEIAPQPRKTIQPAPRMVEPRLPSVPPVETPSPIQVKPRVVEPAPRVVAPKALPEPTPPRPSQRTPEITQPRIVPAEIEPALPSVPDELPSMEFPSDSSDPTDIFGDEPPALPTAPEPAPMKDEGSIFDALDDLDDPFKEDAARLSRPYKSVRPTGHRSSSVPHRSYRPIPQRAPQPAIGSGLRPATSAALLRPVSHEEPVGLRPMGSGKVLAPYRPSRR